MKKETVFDLWPGATTWPSKGKSTSGCAGSIVNRAKGDNCATLRGTLSQNKPAGRVGTSRLKSVFLTAILGMLVAFEVSAQKRSELTTRKLKIGDIIYADSGNAMQGGCIIKVDADTGEQSVMADGGNLIRPGGVTLDERGQILVSDSGRCCTLTRIDPASGRQVAMTRAPEAMLGVPYGLALAPDGGVMVANGETIVRLDPRTGRTRVVVPSDPSLLPIGLGIAKEGHLFVINRILPNEIIRVNPDTGAWTVVSRGGYFHSPQAIAVHGDDLYITDVASPDGNFGVGRVIHVDAQTGAQTIVTEGGNLVGPVGIAVTENGELVVSDPYVLNPFSPDLFDGGIVRVDPATGAQDLIVRGGGNFVNPRGLIVVQRIPTERTELATKLKKAAY